MLMNKENKYLISIGCLTYNQSAYITEALNGIVMQRTNFPFVAVVIDDASTDGEQGVIKAYGDAHLRGQLCHKSGGRIAGKDLSR